MPNKPMLNEDDEKPQFIPVDDDIAEWMKDPEFVREFEALQPKYDKMRRQIRARKARRAWRKAQVKRVRGFWATLMRGIGRIAY